MEMNPNPVKPGEALDCVHEEAVVVAGRNESVHRHAGIPPAAAGLGREDTVDLHAAVGMPPAPGERDDPPREEDRKDPVHGRVAGHSVVVAPGLVCRLKFRARQFTDLRTDSGCPGF